jgi:hypothetical protein
VINNKPSQSRIAKSQTIFGQQKELIFNQHPECLLMSYLLVKYCDDHAQKSVNGKSINKNEEIKYYGNFHIARILRELMEKEKINFNIVNGRIVVDDEKKFDNLYKESFKILKSILIEQNAKERILNYATYLNREIVDSLIFKKLQQL